MIGNQRGLEPLHQPVQASDVHFVAPLGGTQRQANGVQGKWVVGPYQFELGERVLIGHVVLWVHLEPGGCGALGQHQRMVREPQPDPGLRRDRVR